MYICKCKSSKFLTKYSPLHRKVVNQSVLTKYSVLEPVGPSLDLVGLEPVLLQLNVGTERLGHHYNLGCVQGTVLLVCLKHLNVSCDVSRAPLVGIEVELA